MQVLIFIILIIPFLLVGYFSMKYSGYKKGNIVLHLDEWYKDHGKYVKAVEHELKRQGKVARYMGKSQFYIEGKHYRLNKTIERPSGVPTQRTILQPVKEK